MSSAQRVAVWSGEKKRTSGGLTKSDLTKNRHGKIVSKKKSEVARKLNNLGAYLANKDKGKGKKKVQAAQQEKEEEEEKEDEKAAEVPQPKKSPPKPKPKPKKKKKKKLGPKQQKQSDIDKMLQDPEVKRKQADMKKVLYPDDLNAQDIDLANIQRGKRIRKKPKKFGGRISDLGGSLGKQLQVAKERAAKKLPRRARKKRKKKEKNLVVSF